MPSHKPKDVVTCPNCERTVINRLVDYCQYCEAELPDDLVLSKQEKDELASQVRERLEKQTKERDDRVNRKAARRGTSLGNEISTLGDTLID